MVREVNEVSDGSLRYLVEVYYDGVQMPVSCQLITRMGGVYNYEDYRIRPWSTKTGSGKLPESTASTYDLRSGDMVIVGFIGGKAREGVIFGGLRHEARTSELSADNIEYISEFNGLEKKIDSEGAYTVTFKGAPINTVKLDIPGIPIEPPQYDPIKSGSYYGFDNTGGFTIDNNNGVSLSITKDESGGVMTITSGNSTLVMDASNPAQGLTTLTTDELALEATANITINATQSLKAETLQMSLKGTQVAIGNDSIELVDGLLQILDGIGQVTVTSPVGTCTPVAASPQWASTIVPLIVKLNTLKGSL